jgi:hypothetical protein
MMGHFLLKRALWQKCHFADKHHDERHRFADERYFGGKCNLDSDDTRHCHFDSDDNDHSEQNPHFDGNRPHFNDKLHLNVSRHFNPSPYFNGLLHVSGSRYFDTTSRWLWGPGTLRRQSCDLCPFWPFCNTIVT